MDNGLREKSNAVFKVNQQDFSRTFGVIFAKKTIKKYKIIGISDYFKVRQENYFLQLKLIFFRIVLTVSISSGEIFSNAFALFFSTIL